MFFQAGAVKMFAWFGGMPGVPPGTTIPLMSQVGIGAILEVVGGVLIMLGLLTRPVAFILSGEMAVAYWQFHYWPNGGWPAQNQGVPAVLYCFIFLFMAAYGGGDWSLDALIRRKRANAPNP
jgi:putative oxidoreductase